MKAHDTAAWAHPHRFESGGEVAAERRTMAALGLTAIAMVAEVTAGIFFNSMALQADGWHMFTHVGALGIAVFAYRFAREHADDPDFAFGTGKVSALAAYSSALLLMTIAALVVWESIIHLLTPQTVAFGEALPVAGFGLAVNLVTAWILGGHHDHDHDHDHSGHHDDQDQNLRAAYVHVLADAVTSVLAIVALLAGRYGGISWLDPVMGCVGAAVIANWSWGLIRNSGGFLLDRTNQSALRRAVKEAVEREGDSWVADLHLWRVSPRHHAAILSVVTHTERSPDYYKNLVSNIDELSHVTVEVNLCASDECGPGRTN